MLLSDGNLLVLEVGGCLAKFVQIWFDMRLVLLNSDVLWSAHKELSDIAGYI